MTLRELAHLLNALIAENDRLGRSGANDLPVGVRINREGRDGRRLRSHFVTAVQTVSQASLRLGDRLLSTTINVNAADLVK